MIIDNWRLLESIEQSISEYNNQFWREEDEDKKIDYSSIEYSEDGESANIPEEILSKLERLSISLISRDVGEKEIQDITKQLSQMLDVMKLKLFSFSMQARGPQYSHLDISFLEHLNDDIENISITGIDLSQEEPAKFERFKNLKYFSLQKCNISDPKIISEIKPEVFISLERNEISPEYYKDALKLIQSSNGRIKFSVKELKTMAQIYSTRQVELSDYLRLMEVMDFDSISGLTVKMENEFDFENMNNEQIVNLLNEKTNITLKTTPVNLSKLDSDRILKVPTRIIIKNANELGIEELLKHQCITSVQMSDGHNTEKQQGEPYAREEYEMVRNEIDTIISQIELPDERDPNKEKKTFTQIYKILGQRIDYDHNAISEEEKSNERLQITCRNLLGGLLENKCVCAGYADILRNVLACTGIYSEYVGSMPDFENGVPLSLKDPGGHAWNLVRLDGKKYWTDLTWDANNIKAARYPLIYCLKSTKEFKHDSFKKRLEDEIEDPCIESISDEDQNMLFTGKELENRDTSKKQENRNIGYLSNCVMSIADTGLTSAIVRKTANEVSKSTAIQIIKEKETEGVDGRY